MEGRKDTPTPSCGRSRSGSKVSTLASDTLKLGVWELVREDQALVRSRREFEGKQGSPGSRLARHEL